MFVCERNRFRCYAPRKSSTSFHSSSIFPKNIQSTILVSITKSMRFHPNALNITIGNQMFCPFQRVIIARKSENRQIVIKMASALRYNRTHHHVKMESVHPNAYHRVGYHLCSGTTLGITQVCGSWKVWVWKYDLIVSENLAYSYFSCKYATNFEINASRCDQTVN